MIHTALLNLPHMLAAAGLNVVVAADWNLGQGNYLWTDPHTNRKTYDNPPSGYMVHHTAGTRATPPPHNTSKANAWIGLLRDGKLYQTGGGTPTIYLATAGPARISSGSGYRPAAWDYTFRDLRAPAKAKGPDGATALNRYVFNVEVVHAGDGTPLDAEVWGHVVGLGIVLHQMFGWTERTLGHLSWTPRKIGPYWNGDRLCIINIQYAIAKGLEMVEAPNIDECSPWQTTAWQKASDFGILTVDSHPQEPLNKGDLMVFLNRLNLFNGGE